MIHFYYFMKYILTVLIFLQFNILANEIIVRNVPEIKMAKQPVDSNSPAYWADNKLYWYGSHGGIWLSEGTNLYGQWTTKYIDFVHKSNAKPVWMESIHQEGNTIFGWYHTEPLGLFPGSTLTAPKIGATVSEQSGFVARDLGLILESSEPLNPNARNGYFAGGHGDFSVILDRDKKYFYFFFDNYGGAAESQGICIARMAYEDRFNPVGKVYKFYNGNWEEKGLGGKVSPIIKVFKAWEAADPDTFWGPSVHWNTHLNTYVMLLNRAQGIPGWSQEGVYISYNKNISNPYGWSAPKKILDKKEFPGWYFFYPQVMGLGHGETEREAGAKARLFVGGISKWEIEFISNHITNFSARAYVDQDRSLIKGFSINNSGKKQFLIRAAGPALSQYGVENYLQNPKILLYNNNGIKIAENDDWDSAIAEKFLKIGAFPFLPSSKDAAMIVELAGPSVYTLQATESGTGSGEVLVEIYELP